MKKKMIYDAPDAELVVIKTEGNFLYSATETMSALGGASVEVGEDYNSGTALDW